MRLSSVSLLLLLRCTSGFIEDIFSWHKTIHYHKILVKPINGNLFTETNVVCDVLISVAFYRYTSIIHS